MHYGKQKAWVGPSVSGNRVADSLAYEYRDRYCWVEKTHAMKSNIVAGERYLEVYHKIPASERYYQHDKL